MAGYIDMYIYVAHDIFMKLLPNKIYRVNVVMRWCGNHVDIQPKL